MRDRAGSAADHLVQCNHLAVRQIIFALIERAQFKLNANIYKVDAVKFVPVSAIRMQL